MSQFKENIEAMIDSIVKQDFEAASNMFNLTISQKVSDRLEGYKQEVGAAFMNQKGEE